MSDPVRLSDSAIARLLDTYDSPTYDTLNGKMALKRFAREVRRTVIREGGQGDCVSVSTAIGDIFDEMGVMYQMISMSEGVYRDNGEEVPHAWIVITAGSLPAAPNDTILDATAEQFFDNRSDVHVVDVDSDFAAEHYTSF